MGKKRKGQPGYEKSRGSDGRLIWKPVASNLLTAAQKKSLLEGSKEMNTEYDYVEGENLTIEISNGETLTLTSENIDNIIYYWKQNMKEQHNFDWIAADKISVDPSLNATQAKWLLENFPDAGIETAVFSNNIYYKEDGALTTQDYLQMYPDKPPMRALYYGAYGGLVPEENRKQFIETLSANWTQYKTVNDIHNEAIEHVQNS